jgi:hypothetical protein
VSKKKKDQDDRLSEPAKSSGQEPGHVKAAAQKTVEEELIEQFQRLLDSADALYFGDSWEGCAGDATG